MGRSMHRPLAKNLHVERTGCAVRQPQRWLTRGHLNALGHTADNGIQILAQRRIELGLLLRGVPAIHRLDQNCAGFECSWLRVGFMQNGQLRNALIDFGSRSM
jgi:hypothetical protein